MLFFYGNCITIVLNPQAFSCDINHTAMVVYHMVVGTAPQGPFGVIKHGELGNSGPKWRFTDGIFGCKASCKANTVAEKCFFEWQIQCKSMLSP